MADYYSGLIVPTSTDEWEGFVENTQAHFRGNAQQIGLIAPIMVHELPRAEGVQGSGWMYGLDLKISAKRLGRELMQAAAAQDAAAAAIGRANRIFVGMFTTPAGRHGSRFKIN